MRFLTESFLENIYKDSHDDGTEISIHLMVLALRTRFEGVFKTIILCKLSDNNLQVRISRQFSNHLLLNNNTKKEEILLMLNINIIKRVMQRFSLVNFRLSEQLRVRITQFPGVDTRNSQTSQCVGQPFEAVFATLDIHNNHPLIHRWVWQI